MQVAKFVHFDESIRADVDAESIRADVRDAVAEATYWLDTHPNASIDDYKVKLRALQEIISALLGHAPVGVGLIDTNAVNGDGVSPVINDSNGVTITMCEYPMPKICPTADLINKTNFCLQDLYTLTEEEIKIFTLGNNIFIAAQLLYKTGAWRNNELITRHLRAYKRGRYEEEYYLPVDYLVRILIDLSGHSDKLAVTNMKVLGGDVASSAKFSEFLPQILDPIANKLKGEPTVIVGDQETWDHMIGAIRINPEKYKNLHAVPGGLHILFSYLNHINEIYGLPIIDVFAVNFFGHDY